MDYSWVFNYENIVSSNDTMESLDNGYERTIYFESFLSAPYITLRFDSNNKLFGVQRRYQKCYCHPMTKLEPTSVLIEQVRIENNKKNGYHIKYKYEGDASFGLHTEISREFYINDKLSDPDKISDKKYLEIITHELKHDKDPVYIELNSQINDWIDASENFISKFSKENECVYDLDSDSD
jgi:hypothetical protein